MTVDSIGAKPKNLRKDGKSKSLQLRAGLGSKANTKVVAEASNAA